jgi:hypothetical protein
VKAAMNWVARSATGSDRGKPSTVARQALGGQSIVRRETKTEDIGGLAVLEMTRLSGLR